MIKPEKPILFKSIEELDEAIKFFILSYSYHTFYHNRQHHFPIVIHTTSDGSKCTDSCSKLLTNDKGLNILRNSVNWEDIKEQYRPEWYELDNSIGKPVWVKNMIQDKWNTDIFLQYEKDNKLCFVCENQSWKIAKPVLPEDCIKGDK